MPGVFFNVEIKFGGASESLIQRVQQTQRTEVLQKNFDGFNARLQFGGSRN